MTLNTIITIVVTCDLVIGRYTSRNSTQTVLLPLDNKTFTTPSSFVCAAKCAEHPDECYNYMYDKTSKSCTLGYWLLPTAALNTSQAASTTRLYSKGMYCNVQEFVTSVGNGRMGMVNAVGKEILVAESPNVFKSCRDVKNSTLPRQLIQLSSGLVVMCDTVTDGGGWTIFQRRVNGSIDFYRNWTEYKYGFGDYKIGDFYLGNENIYCLNVMYPHELRIDMTYKGVSYYAYYSNFTLSSEIQMYKISIKGYSGTVKDSFTVNNNQEFTTYDVDNDNGGNNNCAVVYHGAWWYNACHTVHLNGVWRSKVNSKGLMWQSITGNYDSVSSCEMKIRPRQ
ncbi:ficolin-2-like [Physella acuta]|uniref:ficolin-2-like n=1 Tax=Physella acuta TaxID=109671 RepID=UPI0027DD9DF9|nr:ficolin-2-like [Physella acuta]